MTEHSEDDPQENGFDNDTELPGTQARSAPSEVVEEGARRIRRTPRVTTAEHWEVLRAELLPMFIERRTLAEIADAFGVSINTAGTWRSRLVNDLREEAATMQPRDYVMESMSSLRLARASAWKAVRESEGVKDVRAGLQLVVQIENQSTKLGALIGFYGRADDRPMQTGDDGRGDGADVMQSMLDEFISELNSGVREIEATPKGRGPRVVANEPAKEVKTEAIEQSRSRVRKRRPPKSNA